MRPLHERSQPSVIKSKSKTRIIYISEKIKKDLKIRLEKIPFIGPLGISFWHKLYSLIQKINLLYEKRKTHFAVRSSPLTIGEINATINISPGDITYESLVEYSFQNGKGLILGGDWDKLEKRVEDIDIYAALKEVIVDKHKWEDTLFYKRTLLKIKSGEILWNCSNQIELNNRCVQLNKIISEIQTQGYASQEELGSGNLDDEVIVNIGRDGDLLLSDGAHRLSIAKILGISKIPAKIAVRHSQWMQFRSEFKKLAVEKDGKTYQPLLHPDLQFLPFFHGCVDRFELIKNNINIKKGNLLDLGANLGYFSSRFEDEGFHCVAVESSLRYSYCLEKVRRATNKKFEIINQSILESAQLLSKSYELVLALNIFHHFLKSEETYNKFENFLRKLHCRTIFFEPHQYEEEQMVNSFINYRPDEFVEFIKVMTHLNTSECIGQADDGRIIYKIF